MLLAKYADSRPVVIDAASNKSYFASDIRALAGELRQFTPVPSLAFLLCNNTGEVAAAFFALLEAGIPVLLLDAGTDQQQLSHLQEVYQPDLRIESGNITALPPMSSEVGKAALVRPDPHPELAVLLSTSGSTGSPKLVRLSQTNISRNAEQIAISLGLTTADVGLASLPLHYSFGMSVLTSHAAVGSTVVVTDKSVLDPQLWQLMREHEVTHFPGVPQTYQMLRRLRFTTRQLPSMPSLRSLMQAGGRLDTDSISHFAEAMAQHNGQMFIMYGQTEASPRMTCLPPESLDAKLGSVGLPLVGAHITVIDANGESLAPGEPGTVVFTGPNVMMGYAESRSELALGDTHGDQLNTGDLGFLDDEGYLYLTGRSKRIAKIAGLRISLDDVEQVIADQTESYCVESPEGVLAVCISQNNAADKKELIRQVAKSLHIPPKSIQVYEFAEVPTLPSGKVDYRTLEEMSRHA